MGSEMCIRDSEVLVQENQEPLRPWCWWCCCSISEGVALARGAWWCWGSSERRLLFDQRPEGMLVIEGAKATRTDLTAGRQMIMIARWFSTVHQMRTRPR